MDRQPCESSMLASIGYDKQSKVLELEFRSGGVYRYFGVEPEQVEAMGNAKSLGAFIASNIKGKYESRKVDKDEAPEVEL